MRTGAFDTHGGTPEYCSDYTGLDEDAGELALRARREGLRRRLAQPGQPDQPHLPGAHDVPRATHITHYENLANLDQVVGRRFTFAGFPLRIRDGTGSPVRAVAIVED